MYRLRKRSAETYLRRLFEPRADKLNVSVATVATHKANIFSKTGVNKTVNLIMHAIKYKLIEN
ncbi:MAG TPA: hypothetical protein DCQ31_07800 [Bacteroidales bacterium]|nr:hypothetical protein [Bacteroidales bacterium]